MRPRSRLALTLAVAATLALGAVSASAQEDGDATAGVTSSTTSSTSSTVLPSLTTTSTTSGSATTTTQPGSPDLGGGGTTPAPDGSGPETDGEGGSSTGSVPVPAEAQRIINSVVRSGPSNTKELIDGIQPLIDLGLTRDEAIRVGFGRFPIAGPANYTHDWLFPRYGPGPKFRFHLGCDVFAAYGTPVRSPVDGVAQSATEELGGLYVKVFMADGTFFYMAHLSGLVEGFEQNMVVKTGDIVGYVGDSGNARGGAPHVHFGVYPQGAAPVDPKPILDRFMQDAVDRLPEVIAYYQQQRGNRNAAGEVDALTSRPLLATSAIQHLMSPAAPPGLPTDVLYLSSADPVGGAVRIAAAEADAAAVGIDWDRRQALAEARVDVASRSVSLLRIAFMPFASYADTDRFISSAVQNG